MPKDEIPETPPCEGFETVWSALQNVEALRKLREKQKTPEPVDA